MSEASEVFQELFFGTGSWLGLLFIIGLCVVLAYNFKKSGVLLFPITFILGLEYLANSMEWHTLTCMIATGFILLILYRDLK